MSYLFQGNGFSSIYSDFDFQGVPSIKLTLKTFQKANIPRDRVVGPLPNRLSWLIHGGDPNHLRVLQVSNDKNPGCLGCVGDYTTQTIIRIPSKHPIKWKERVFFFRSSTGMSFFKLPSLKPLPTSKSLLSRFLTFSSTVRDV